MLRVERLDPRIFNLPVEKMRAGYYSDTYFNRAREILRRDGHRPRVRMQVFQRGRSVLCGIDEALAIVRTCSGSPGPGADWIDGWSDLTVRALHDGDEIAPFETVMTIEGDYTLFAHLETLYLGVLSRRTRIATNARVIVSAANGKEVLFFPARYDHHQMQTGDGYAAYISGALGVSTDANAEWWGSRGMGTVPHALIAAYGGDTVLATQKFAQHIDPDVHVIALVDRSLWSQMGTFTPTGVVPQLVRNVRDALDANGFGFVKIVVSGGFDAAKIRQFEDEDVPVDAYAVGSAFFEGTGKFDFTADIVAIERDGVWVECHKVGRPERPNPRLARVV